MARAAATARATALLRKAATDAARLAAAEQAYKEGDVRLASKMYMSLARAKSPVATEAKQRLTQLADDARRKLREIDLSFTEKETLFSPSELFSRNGPPTEWQDRVTAVFQEYDRLAEDYCCFRPAEREITKHITKQRRREEFVVVLNEPEAKALWDSGQEHEADGHLCCAYWVYERAAKLTPAPSARLAYDRLAEMKEDPQIIASAQKCREMQECHKDYNRAKRLADRRPDRARHLFEEILSRAPEDSEVYHAALANIQQIKQRIE